MARRLAESVIRGEIDNRRKGVVQGIIWLEGIDWIRTADGDIRHPLQHRCFESAMKVWHQCDELGLCDADDDVALFAFEFQHTAVKLGGALNGIAEGRDPFDPAFTVASLKRALDRLHRAQAALETVATKRRRPEDQEPLLPNSLVDEARQELFASMS